MMYVQFAALVALIIVSLSLTIYDMLEPHECNDYPTMKDIQEAIKRQAEQQAQLDRARRLSNGVGLSNG